MREQDTVSSLRKLHCSEGNRPLSWLESKYVVPSPSKGFPGGPRGKEPACQCRSCRRLRFNPWVGKIPWRRSWQPTPAFLPGESHGHKSLVGYSPQGRKALDTTEATQQACTVDGNPPAKAGNMSQNSDLGRFHVPWATQACGPQLLKPASPGACMPQLLSRCVGTTKARAPRACALQQEKPLQ